MSFGGLSSLGTPNSNMGGAVFTVRADVDPMIASLKKAEIAARKAADAMEKDLVRSSKRTAQGFLQLGYAVDDLQYGFGAIANNIPQIAMGFGAGAGLAGGIAIAVTGVNVLMKSWGYLSDALQANWSGGSLEQLQNLRKRAEEAAEGFKKLAEIPTKAAGAQAKYTEEAITEAGVEKVRKAVAEALTVSPQGEQMTFEEQRLASGKMSAFEEMRAGVMGGGANPAEYYREKAAQRIADVNRKEAERLIYESTLPDEKGRLAKQRLHGLGGLPPDVTNALNPESAKRQSDFEKAADARKQVEAKIKAADAAHLGRMEKEGDVDEKLQAHKKRLAMAALGDDKRLVEEIVKRGEHELTPEGKKQLQDAILKTKAPTSSHMLSAKAASDKLLIDSLNKVPERQLKTLVGMHATLKNIDAKMRALGLQ